MNLQSFGISNFKAFGPVAQSIPIKPITLVFGPNSAGKSSLLHSFLWMNHALSQGELDVRFPKEGKNQIDLGGFSQVIHDHAQTPRVMVELVFAKDSLPAALQKAFSIETGVSLDLSFGYPPGFHTANPALLDYRLKIDGEDFLSAIQHRRGFKVSSFDWSQVKKNSTDGSKPKNDSGIQALCALIGGVENLTEVEVNELLDAVSRKFFQQDAIILGRLLPVGFEVESKPSEVESKSLIDLLSRLIRCVAEEAQDAFKGLKYVPPLRDIPERYFDLSGADEAWQRLFDDGSLLERVNEWLGGDTFKTKYRLVVAEYLSRTTLERELPGLLRTELVRTAVCGLGQENAISEEIGPVIEELREIYSKADVESILRSYPDLLEDLLETAAGDYVFQHEHDPETPGPYTKGMSSEEIRKYTDTRIDWVEWLGADAVVNGEPYATELFIKWASEQPPLLELLDRNDHNDPSYASREFLKSRVFAGRNVRREILLRHKHKNTDVSLQDVGVGISQVLPVILNAFGEKQKLIAIEQPEIHIHPALQAELGDVFIESALGANKNTFLLETHSEHLILRILRRIRETTRQKLPDGALSVRPDDVAVLYVEPGEDGSTVRELRINDQGRFIDDWPNGFFEERFNEEF